MERERINLTFYERFCKYVLYAGNNMQLENMEKAVRERLRLLHVLDSMLHQPKKFKVKWLRELTKRLKEKNLEEWVDYIQNRKVTEALAQADYASHCVLLHAHKNDPLMRSWFIKHEQMLFHYKCVYAELDEIKTFIKDNQLRYSVVSNEDKLIIRQQTGVRLSRSKDIFKIEWDLCPSLMSNTDVLLYKGYVYARDRYLIDYVKDTFDRRLLRRIKEYRAVKNLDERVTDLCEYVRCVQGPRLQPNVSDVDIEDLDVLYTRSFPRCAANLWSKLNSTHHLKYHERVQLGLFLKSVGLSVEQQLELWRDIFLKGMDEETYRLKRYDYYIRYMYGLEGSMTDGAPLDCETLVHMGQNIGCFNGCPYVYEDEQTLGRNLHQDGLSVTETTSVLELKTNGCYQQACTKHLLLRHKLDVTRDWELVQSPHKYLERSMKYDDSNSSSASSTASLDQY